MKEEIRNFVHVEQAAERNARNGYYERTLDTRYGKIEDLLVPRDRRGDFRTHGSSHINGAKAGSKRPSFTCTKGG